MSLFFCLFLLLCLLGYFSTKGLVAYAHKKQLLDVANHRSSHTKATPRIGGLSFVVLISILGAIYAILNGMNNLLFFSLIPAVLVASTGLADDILGLKRTTRFAIYFLGSLIALGNLTTLFSQPYWLIVFEMLVLSVGLTWLINLYNFMDGIDGIAASESIFVLFALAFFCYQTGSTNFCYLLLLCIAPLIGFLILNWQPAKIFMGDIGSTFLGCLIGTLCLFAINEKIITFYTAIILLACFIVDASWTLAYRVVTKQQWYQPHRSHSYQILSRKYQSHQHVSLLYLTVNVIWLFPLSVAANYWQEHGLLITTISLLPLIGLCFIIGAGKVEKN